MTALLFIGAAGSAALALDQIPGQAERGYIEIHGVGAAEFNLDLWEANTLHLVPDMRHPLLAPRMAGVYRNIYAPSAVRLENGWKLFYGAWDGIDTGNDMIYSVFTRDFIDFGERNTVIANGVFTHVCNVNALARPGGGFDMMCTVFPDRRGRNKPAWFSSPDGVHWNGHAAPYPADYADIVSIAGYEGYEDADINGMNVIFRDGEMLHLYFNNFRDFGKVFHAVGTDGKHWTLKGVALERELVVNDVKRFETPRGKRWLMGLHVNREALWYSLSEDGHAFRPEQSLLTHAGPEDRYIVSLGWVTDGNRLLGVLYGAGAVPELNRNRIFARWLQKKTEFHSKDGTVHVAQSALGPDRQIIRIPEGTDPQGVLRILAEDGITLLGDPIPIRAEPGAIFRLRANPTP